MSPPYDGACPATNTGGTVPLRNQRALIGGITMRSPQSKAEARETSAQDADHDRSGDEERIIARTDHDDEADWVLTHPELLHPYSDEWVAVVGREVVAHGPSMSDALRAARDRGYDDPLLVPVMPPDLIFIG
jgi:hypothetical protein